MSDPLPPWPEASLFSYSKDYDKALIIALRARLKLAVDSLDLYHANCDELHHASRDQHKWGDECPVVKRIQSIIAACKEPS